ncbi:FecR family protein [Parapedobacter deserti]|uniref:FecR family protein n=1 Tax=Parapedobacter deserti TaxID=1912957 RepID=A0ABV7JKP1_9SPHI
MNRNVEDILGGDGDPRQNLDKEPDGPIKRMAASILNILNSQPNSGPSLEDREQLWAQIKSNISKINQQRNKNIRRLRLAAAASIASVFTVSLWFWLSPGTTQAPIAHAALSNQNLLLDTSAIKLKGSGERIFILNDTAVIDLSLLSVRYGGRGTTDSFNTLTVPYGKRTEVVLPDGSKAWLNAGSQLTFPQQFDTNKREIYLEGEGYFDVVHDFNKPFLVHTADMLIKVLGTAFNVSSYRDDAFTSTVLVSGKIELQGVGKQQFKNLVLEPGSTAVLQKNASRLEIRKDDVQSHISWTQRQLILKSTPLAELLIRLERIYNTEIVAVNEVVRENETFSGRLDLTQPLVRLLAIIYDQQAYDINQEERRIIIQQKSN